MKPNIDKKKGGVDNDSAIVDEVEIPDFRFISVLLTFEGYPPFRFKFRRQQSKEVKEAKQAFYDQTDEEQTSTLKSYRVGILSGLLEKRPTGIFGFPDTEDFIDAFKEFFNSEDNDDLLQWVWSQYQAKLYPKELLSSPLE